MKKISLTIVTGCVLFTACTKSSSTSTTPTTTTPTTTTPTTTPTPNDGWIMNGAKYTQVYCLKQDNQFILNCVNSTTKPVHSFAVCFHAYPTTGGKFKVVNFASDSTIKYPGEKIAANEVIVTGNAIDATTGVSTGYWSTGVEGKEVTVTITGGKMKIEVPEVAIQSKGDTVKITGTMIEN